MKLIGFTGQMGSGKSTAIEQLKQLFDGPVYNVKFAQPLYDMQEAIYDRIKDVHQRPEGFLKDRKLLQWLGTEWGRGTISQTIWVDIWKSAVHKTVTLQDKIIVCDDVRFDNEAETVKAMGGFVIRIVSDKTRIEKTNTGHSSEAGVSDALVDAIIDNSGDIETLKLSLQTLNGTLGIW